MTRVPRAISAAHWNTGTARDKTAALKEIEKRGKMVAELTVYENEVLCPLVTQQVAIDLDDGVKVSSNKFGKARRFLDCLNS